MERGNEEITESITYREKKSFPLMVGATPHPASYPASLPPRRRPALRAPPRPLRRRARLAPRRIAPSRPARNRRLVRPLILLPLSQSSFGLCAHCMHKRPRTNESMYPFKRTKTFEEEIRELSGKIVTAAEQGKDGLVVELKQQQAELKQQQAKTALEKAQAAYDRIKKPGVQKNDAKERLDHARAVYLALLGRWYRFP